MLKKKNNLTILTSKSNKYEGQIDKIINQASFKVNKVYIEDNFSYDDSIIYSFANVTKITKNIINYKFYLNYKDKKQIQIALSNKIFTPNILNKVETIAYLKENKHEGVVRKVKKNELIELNNYYLEEVIEGKEYKYYFVFDSLFDNLNTIFDNNLLNIAKVIKETLLLDIFSFDVIKKDNINYVIDVNVSPGFYKSDVARNHFISYIERNFLWEV